MGLIEQETFVCLDCETTGLEPREDRMIEIALRLFNFKKVLDSFETLINPEQKIPKNTITIHHITDEMVAEKPKAKQILRKVLTMIDHHTIVGHGISMDIAFIAEECKRAQIPCNIENVPFFDTLRMARLYGESPVNSLQQLRKHFNIAEEGAHRAMSDVIVNIEVFKRLCKGFKTPKDLRIRMERPILLKMMPLGKHKGRRFSEIPTEYLQWAVNKKFDKDLMFSIKSELKTRNKGHRFYQASNPFSEL